MTYFTQLELRIFLGSTVASEREERETSHRKRALEETGVTFSGDYSSFFFFFSFFRKIFLIITQDSLYFLLFSSIHRKILHSFFRSSFHFSII